MTQLNFDASQVDPQPDFQPIPEGYYAVVIKESEVKPTKLGDGAYLQLTFLVIEGNYTNRTIFARLNIQNKNAVAQSIAFQQLSAICHATGVIQVQDSSQLHGIALKIKVIVRPPKDGYDASNDIKAFVHINYDPNNPKGNTPPAPPTTLPPPAIPAAGALPIYIPPPPTNTGGSAPPALPPWVKPVQ